MSAIGPGGGAPVDPTLHTDPSGGAPATAPADSDAGAATVDRTSSGARLSITPSSDGLDVVSRLRVEDDAASYVESAIARMPGRLAGTTRRLLREAATLDENRVLTRAEAEKVIEPALAALPGGVGELRAALADADAWLDTERAREAEVRDGVDVFFNSDPDGPSLTGKILEELDAAVAEADGRKLDIHILIFSFTDGDIANKLLDIAEQNPNANIRMIADWTQSTEANGYKPAWISKEAARRGLTNLEVKFKKDQPYRWDANAGRIRWDHGITRGLNHHKGIVSLIDGRPRSMVTGSFNWSPTAESKNYENVMTLDGAAATNRQVMRSYEEEFEAFWNDGRVSLTLAETKDHKRAITRAFEADPTIAPSDVEGLTAGAGAHIDLLAPEDILDLNDVGAGDRIAALFGGGETGREVALAMQAERMRFGRFEDVEDLIARVPAIASLGQDVVGKVSREALFGSGRVSVNDATREQLIASGATRAAADAIVTWREAHGDFASLEDVRALPEVSGNTWYRMRRFITEDVTRVAFAARVPSEEAGDAGYAQVNEESTVPVLQPDGTVVHESNTIGAGVVDMARRARPGETLKLATYGLSMSTPEYAALVEAARSGVKLKVILNKKYNEGVAAALRDLAATEGLDIDLKTSSRTMHQKYMVHVEGEDAFNGSANLSSSATRKHSEDRFFVKNNAAVARAFETDFDRLWGRLPG
jgi:phosphatidylserine/phosphatidylglycerophosphate/cardiolipin synthase-like enzyme/DNA uptake protein ComE-like DNA-binding protein